MIGQIRNKKWAVNDFNNAVDILARCDTVHMAINGEEYPYVVPVSFGYEVIDSTLFIYIHGSGQGYKYELLAKDSHVCIEAERFLNYAYVGKGVTALYESVICFGTAKHILGQEKNHALELIAQHCGAVDYKIDYCARLESTTVHRISVDIISAKRNIRELPPV